MRAKLFIDEFYQEYKEKLKLSLISLPVGLENEIQTSTLSDDSYEAVDYLNLIRPSSVVVIGLKESIYLSNLTGNEQVEVLDSLFKGPVSSVLVSIGVEISDTVVKLCEKWEVPVFRAELEDADLLSNTRYYLSLKLADHTLEHGVYIEVSSVGVFITGDSGVGKSELGLALISRGHRLIADDVTEFSRIAPDTIDGHSPGLLADFMEVRGLGIVNIRAMYGSNAVKRNKTLRMIIRLVPFDIDNSYQFDRLGNKPRTRDVLGIEIPEYYIPVAPGRNLSILVEAAVRNHLLALNGYNAGEDFIEKQRQAMLDSAAEI